MHAAECTEVDCFDESVVDAVDSLDDALNLAYCLHNQLIHSDDIDPF